jgi:hypothetical protein
VAEQRDDDNAALAAVQALPPPPPPSRGHPGRLLRRTGLVTAVGGGALLGLAGYFAYRADDRSTEVERRYNSGVPWSQLAELDADGRRDSRLATAFALSGGLAVFTGSVLYVVGQRQEARAERMPRFSVGPTSEGGQVRLSWVF